MFGKVLSICGSDGKFVQIFVENVEGNEPLVKYRHKCVIIFK